MPLLLDVSNLNFRHPDGTQALKDISFQLSEGESLAIFGPNGSGKTTLLLHINGILRGEGTIQVDGLDVCGRNIGEIRRRVGLVFQNADEQLFMPTVLDDVMFGPLNLGFDGAVAEKKARCALVQAGIPDELLNRPPFHLSAGEKRRVTLAGVLAMEPKMLLLDEPTTALDPPGQRALLELLRRIPQPKLIATHDVHFAANLSERAIFLDKGRLIADGPLDEIVTRFDWRPRS